MTMLITLVAVTAGLMLLELLIAADIARITRNTNRRTIQRIESELVVFQTFIHTIDDLIRIEPERAEMLELSKLATEEEIDRLRREIHFLAVSADGSLRETWKAARQL